MEVVRVRHTYTYTHINLTTQPPQKDNKERRHEHLTYQRQECKKNRNMELSPSFLVVVGLLAPVQLFVLSFRPSTTLSSLSSPPPLHEAFPGKTHSLSDIHTSRYKQWSYRSRWLLQSTQCEKNSLYSLAFPGKINQSQSYNLTG